MSEFHKFHKFPSIQAFHHRATAGRRVDHQQEGFFVFPKLHGTNAGIGVFSDGNVTAQSRNRLLDVHDDNAGFANFVDSLEITPVDECDIVFYGEWCGGTIQRATDAICMVPDKYFVIFAIRSLKTNMMINDPEYMKSIATCVFGDLAEKNIMVMEPICELTISFSSPDQKLQEACDIVNEIVESFETCCSFTKEHFGIESSGEGVVVSPVNAGFDHYAAWTFKAKTQAHAVNKYKKPSVPVTEISETALEFVERFATEARFNQAVQELDIEFDMRHTGDFLKWVMQDIAKESEHERHVSGLEWSAVNKPLISAAKGWFVSKVNGQ